MKPASFKYYAPTTVDEALELLAEHGYDAKPLAGGQSLIPTMNFRLSQPSVLIDLNNIAELFYIRPNDDGGLRIGAMTRQSRVELDPLVAERAPLVHETMPYIAHSQIRNRGTLGGTLAHNDPSAELPAVTLARGGRLRLRSQSGGRWVSTADFFWGLFTTALESDELLVEVEFPPLPPRTGWSIREMARRPGDYALMGVTALVTLDGQDRCHEARLVFFGTGGEDPTLAQQAGEVLRREVPTADLIRTAAETAAEDGVEVAGDIHASAEYRRHLARVLARRALQQAFGRAAIAAE